MKQRVETFIPRALEAIQNVGISTDGKTIASPFYGYISSFGAAARQSGLMATILFFSNENANTEAERYRIIKALEEIVEEDLFQLVQNGQEEKILDAAVALKLAMRAYKKEK